MSYDVCAIGNALVDIIVSTDDKFLQAQNIVKGSMALVDEAAAASLYKAAGAAVEMSSGGSAANTLAGIASLGGRCAFLGKVGADEFGRVFTHDLRAQNIHFSVAPSQDLATGRCLILVTPDAQRSMNTFLGAASEFGPDGIDEIIVQQAAITYMEGYLFDKPLAQKAFQRAAKIAHSAGRKVALTLSDSFCVSRHKDAFMDLVKGNIDILFANESELKSLYDTPDFLAALSGVRAHTGMAVITRGAKGAIIVSAQQTVEIPAAPASAIVDTTGAGDLYAAGFLYGITKNKSLLEAGQIGAIAAAEIISHYGPRPQTKLSTLI